MLVNVAQVCYRRKANCCNATTLEVKQQWYTAVDFCTDVVYVVSESNRRLSRATLVLKLTMKDLQSEHTIYLPLADVCVVDRRDYHVTGMV